MDMSSYGQSIFADAINAVQAVDLAFDAMINKVECELSFQAFPHFALLFTYTD